MRLAVIAAVLCFVATAAEAQVCYRYDGMMTCSNGATGFRYRNSTADPSVTPRRNETTMYGDPAGAYYGSVTTFSDGPAAYTYGSTTVTADGRSCYRYGSALICSRPHQGLAPSSSYAPPLGTSRRGLQ
jgi:hypothetical protein